MREELKMKERFELCNADQDRAQNHTKEDNLGALSSRKTRRKHFEPLFYKLGTKTKSSLIVAFGIY